MKVVKFYYDNNIIKEKQYFQEDKSQLTIVRYYENGSIQEKRCLKNNLLHHTSGPAVIYYNKYDKKITREYYYLNGIEYLDILKYMVAVGSM